MFWSCSYFAAKENGLIKVCNVLLRYTQVEVGTRVSIFFSQTLVLAEQKMSNGAMISGSNFIVQCAPLSKLPPAIAT